MVKQRMQRMNVKDKKTLKFYVCGTAYDTDMALGAPDFRVFETVKDLKLARSCWVECGIYELEISVKRVVKKPTTPY